MMWNYTVSTTAPQVFIVTIQESHADVANLQ